MGKNKKKQKQKHDEAPRPRAATGLAPLSAPPVPAVAPVASPREEREALRATVGRGTLAGEALAAIEAAIGELERVYAEVAALGSSLALAREQLAEQEAELEAAQEPAVPKLAGADPPR